MYKKLKSNVQLRLEGLVYVTSFSRSFSYLINHCCFVFWCDLCLYLFKGNNVCISDFQTLKGKYWGNKVSRCHIIITSSPSAGYEPLYHTSKLHLLSNSFIFSSFLPATITSILVDLINLSKNMLYTNLPKHVLINKCI